MDAARSTLLQNIFISYKPVLDKKRLPLHHIKAIESITECRNGKLGTNYYQCEHGHKVQELHHSCRHRSCYLCARGDQQQWIEKQKRRLLNTPHYHVVFTLPSEYRVLWQYNTGWFTGVLFRCVQESVLSLTADNRHGGYTPGLLLNLHTWGRQLSLHPHIHALVTAGGTLDDGRWVSARKGLLPARVLMLLYRGKLQAQVKAALASGELRLPPSITVHEVLRLHRKAYKKAWHVRIEPQYRHGRGVLLYLSRYLKGGPINPSQITECHAGAIGFRYKDHRDGRIKQLTLAPLEFLRRLLLHVPVKGVHTVRHYGLYAAACRDKRNTCRDHFGDLAGREVEAGHAVKERLILTCKVCGEALRLRAQRCRRRWQKGISIKRGLQLGATTAQVQQDDEPILTNLLRFNNPCHSSG